MMEKLARAVARELYRGQTEYPTQKADLMWEVVSDHEKALCRRIAAAVLDELRDPSPDMLRAADTALGNSIAEVKSGAGTSQAPDDLLRRMLVAMMDVARER